MVVSPFETQEDIWKIGPFRRQKSDHIVLYGIYLALVTVVDHALRFLFSRLGGHIRLVKV